MLHATCYMQQATGNSLRKVSCFQKWNEMQWNEMKWDAMY